MVIARQMEVRSNIKKYFDLAYEGEPVIVPRKDSKNVVIISESMYNRLAAVERLKAYGQGISDLTSRHLHTGEVSPTDVKSFNLHKLDAISNLKHGWNGNDAPAFERVLIERVRYILDHIEIQPEIFPTALSTIQFEYDNSRRDHMEIEIGMEDMAEVFLVSYDGVEAFEDIHVDCDSLNMRVREFYG